MSRIPSRLFFPDPYISSGMTYSISPSRPPIFLNPPSSRPDNVTEITVATTLRDLPEIPVIVYRNEPTGTTQGPQISIPFLNLSETNLHQNASAFIGCISTYPDKPPYNPIADRFRISFYHDSWILTLADGCGLGIGSRLASLAAVQGFWDHFSSVLKNNPHLSFNTSNLASTLYESFGAAHIHIFWKLFETVPDGLLFYRSLILTEQELPEEASLRENLLEMLLDETLSEKQISFIEREGIPNIPQQQEGSELHSLLEVHRLLEKAASGDTFSKKCFLENYLDRSFFEKYTSCIGSTTFLTSALVKGLSGEGAPYYLVTINLGDSQGFLFKDGKVKECIKTSRPDLSNVRDTGGRLGFCCKSDPLKIHIKNARFSITPCYGGEVLFFMTDGVSDNLDPERLGLSPNGEKIPSFRKEHLCEAAGLEEKEAEEVFSLLNESVEQWTDLSEDRKNQIKEDFTIKFLEALISRNKDPEQANAHILEFCKNITAHFRKKKEENLSFKSALLMGKPDHTTCLTLQIPL